MWRRSWRCSTSVATVLLAYSFSAPAVSAPAQKSGAEAGPSERLARSVLKSEACQTEMPQERTEKPPFALLVFGRYAIWGLYALLGVSLLLLAWWFVEEFGGRTSGIGGARAVVVGNRGEAASPAASLSDVERWAQLGDYREAIHALLLVAIQRLIEPLPARPGPSRTSRELQRLLPLGPGRREAFAALVRHVEVSIFGDHAVDSRRYAECREAFDALFAGHET